MLLTVFIKAHIFSELCFLFLCHVRCARSFTPLAPPSPPLLGFLSTLLPPWTRWTVSPTQVNQMLRSPQPSNQLEPVTLITAQRYVERIPSWMRLFSPSCLSSRCFTGLFLCHWALHHRTASCWKTKQKNCHFHLIKSRRFTRLALSLYLSLSSPSVKHSYLDRETSLILKNIAGKPVHLLTKVTHCLFSPPFSCLFSLHEILLFFIELQSMIIK